MEALRRLGLLGDPVHSHGASDLAFTYISRNSFWKFEGLGRCGNCGNSGNLGVWRGGESGNSGNLALKMPDFQSSGNLTLSQQKLAPGPKSVLVAFTKSRVDSAIKRGASRSREVTV